MSAIHGFSAALPILLVPVGDGATHRLLLSGTRDVPRGFLNTHLRILRVRCRVPSIRLRRVWPLSPGMNCTLPQLFTSVRADAWSCFQLLSRIFAPWFMGWSAEEVFIGDLATRRWRYPRLSWVGGPRIPNRSASCPPAERNGEITGN